MISRADKEGSLGMCEFQFLYLYTPVQSSSDFRIVSFLQQQLNRFLEHRFGLFIRSALTGDA